MATFVAGRDEIEGYTVTREERDSYGGRLLRVLEMGALNRRAWRTLLGVLGQFEGEAVEWHACSTLLQESGLLRSPAPLREGYKPRGIVTVRPMFQVRLVNLRAALVERFRTGRGSPLRLALRVRDEVLPENAEPVLIARGASGTRVRAPRDGEPWLETSIQTLSQIYAGYLPAAEAVLLGQARVSGDEALEAAEELFPAGEPFLSELDRF
jgi:predicted acetyltransferase